MIDFSLINLGWKYGFHLNILELTTPWFDFTLFQAMESENKFGTTAWFVLNITAWKQ